MYVLPRQMNAEVAEALIDPFGGVVDLDLNAIQ